MQWILQNPFGICKIIWNKYEHFKYDSFTGGSVSIPLEKSENNKIQEIGDSFYTTCEANEQSGKTLWIGIERNTDFDWVVRGL